MAEPHIQRAAGIDYLHRPGAGRALVFLHGIGSNATSFRALFDLLPEDQTIIAWNAPGYLGSAPLDMDWPVASDYAAALCGMLNELGLDQVDLVGHSLGALMAAAFAERFPDRIGALILVSAASGYKAQPGGTMPAKVAARIEDLAQLGPVDFAKSRAPNLVHDPDTHRDVVQQVEAAMVKVNRGGYAQAARMLASGDLNASLCQVARRPNFIIGAQDRVTPIDHTRVAAEAWQTAHGSAPPIRVVDRAGHAVYAQQPRAFAAAVMEMMHQDDAAPFDVARNI